MNSPSLYYSLYAVADYCKDKLNEKIDIIVPDKLSLFMERFLFENVDVECSFNIKVSTLNRYAKKSLVFDKDKQLSKIGAILSIHKILNDNIENLGTLRSKAYSFKYAENIYNTICQLKSSKITFDEMEAFSSNDEQLNSKIHDLAKVFKEYENQKAGMLDQSDLFLMSTFTVAQGKEGRKILFVGFDDFTAIEYAILERLALVSELLIFDSFADNTNKHIYNNEIYSQLSQIAFINKLPLDVEDIVVKPTINSFLSSNIFATKMDRYTLQNDEVKIYSMGSVKDEIENAARDIRFQVLKGKRYKDFGVCVYGLENYSELVEEIFEKYEINYYIDQNLVLSSSVLYKFLCSLLKYNSEYNLCHLIDLINSPFFVMDSNSKELLIDKLISINYAGKIKENFILDIDGEILNKLKIFVKIIDLDLLETNKSLISQIREVMTALSVEEKNEELAVLASSLQAKILLVKSKENIDKLFEEIEKFYKNIDFDTLFDIILHAPEVMSVNNLPQMIDAVKVVEAKDNMEIFKNLYVLNCTSENAPNIKSDCGIILDADIEKLNFKHKLSPTIAHINRLNKLRLFNSTLMFEKSLIISYNNQPSEIIRELAHKLCVKIGENIVSIPILTNFNYDKYLCLSKWDEIEFKCGKNKYEDLIGNKNFENLSRENLSIYNDMKTVSASYLEGYFACPFLSFLRDILKIQPREAVEIQSMDIGNVLHEILFEYYKAGKQIGDRYEFCKNKVFEYVDKIERLKLKIDSPILTNLIDEAMRVLDGVDYIDANSDFKPQMFECSFVGKTSLKLKNIDIKGKIDRVDVFGDMLRIVDYKSGSANATLKELYYGNKLQLFLYSCAIENMLNKKTIGCFYLPLHNEYTREIGNNYALSGFYLNENFVLNAFDKRLDAGVKSDIVNVNMTKSGTARKTRGYKELDNNQLLQLKNYAKQVSEQAVEEIKSGYISPSANDNKEACKYCPYSQICLHKTCGKSARQTMDVKLTSFEEVENA